jgi:hypothetical protein
MIGDVNVLHVGVLKMCFYWQKNTRSFGTREYKQQENTNKIKGHEKYNSHII